MPLYEYACEKCGKSFEHLAKAPEDRPETCPACGSKRLKKAFSAFSALGSSAGGGGGGHSCSPGGCCPCAG